MEQPHSNIHIIYDDIVFSLQRAGGISVCLYGTL